MQAGESSGTAFLDPILNWCNNTNSNTGATQVGIGQGGINTSYINTNCTSGAGKVAADLVLNGKNDWYLPSKNELAQMAIQYNLIGLNYGVNNCWSNTCYWTSTESAASSAYAYLFSSVPLYSGNNGKGLTANAKVLTRPIRAFSPLLAGSETVTAGAPTNAGTYLLRPTSITLTNNVDTNNYVAVVYQSSKFTINRIAQSPKINMKPAVGSFDTGTATLPLTASGGTGNGFVFYLIGSGSTSGCSISGTTLTIASEGTCNVVAYKQASPNYYYDSATVVSIVFYKFKSNQPIQVQLYPSMIPLNGANSLETATATIPIISSVTNSGGGAYVISGSGFAGTTNVSIGGTAISFTLVNSTSINITGAGSAMGPLMIECGDGRIGPVPFWMFTP